MLKTGLSYLNNSATSTLSNSINSLGEKSNMFFVARVIDINLNNNSEIFNSSGGWAGIGSIKFQQLEVSVNPSSKNQENTTFAKPFTGQLKNFPLVNELVLIFRGPSTEQTQITNTKNFYYINTVALWGNQHTNAYPDSYFTNTDLAPSMNKSNTEITAGSTQKRTEQTTTIPLNGNSGGTFIEKGNIHPVLPYAGDHIFEGRFGNSIRLGNTSKTGGLQNNWSSTGDDGSPITILKNGQPSNSSEQGYVPIVEDINEDPSSIYLTSTQKIPIEVATSTQSTGEAATIPFNNLVSKTPISPTSYNAPQVVLNSGRLLFNTTTDSIIFSSQKSFVAESREDMGLKSLEGNLTLATSNGVVFLGKKDASQSLVMGDDFAIQFDALVGAMKNLCKALSKESQTPIAAAASELLLKTLEGIQQQVPNFLSKQVKTN
jgi:hypothetical protein